MHTLFARFSRRSISIALVCALAAGCAGDHPLTGTWRQPNGSTMLPDTLGGGQLMVDATLTLDGRASPATFDLILNLAYMGLHDTIHAQGTYVASGSNLALTFTHFVIDPASGNVPSIVDGMQCITLQGFAGTPVCFPTPQTHAYALTDTLTITLQHTIGGSPVSTTTLTLERMP
jgi:hypothetical protein